jgi:hypothetical protein
MALWQTKDQTLRTYLVKTDNISAQADASPYGELRIQPFGLLNNVLAVSSNYTILDDQIYTRYEVDTTAGDVTITLPLITNNNYRPIEIAFVKGSTYKVIISPNISDANKLTYDALNVIWLSKVGDNIKFVHSPTSGYWESVREHIKSQLRLYTYAGYGSTDNKIVRFTNTIDNYGNMFSENHSTGYSSNAKGLEITINRSGLYTVHYQMDIVNVPIGLSLNSAQLTTSIMSITKTAVLCTRYIQVGTYNADVGCNITLYFKKGDVIRPHNASNTAPADNDLTKFDITYMGQG